MPKVGEPARTNGHVDWLNSASLVKAENDDSDDDKDEDRDIEAGVPGGISSQAVRLACDILKSPSCKEEKKKKAEEEEGRFLT